MRIFFALVIALVAACATEPYDSTDLHVRADTAFANDQTAFDFFIAKGLTNFQAAGIVGNLDQESGVNPSSVQADGPGRGIAQWSVGGRWDTSANDNVAAYAAQQGDSMTSLNLQLEFIWYELTTIGYGYSALKATTNVTDATIAFMDDYEICGDCLSSQRVAYAQDVLAAYGQIPYGASYVSQSWPLASAPAMTIKCGESVAASIVLLNTGTDAWTTSTKLGTTMPRDRTSIFAGSDWLAPNRAATSGAVAPGAKGTFKFSFTGPVGAACVPGTYTEYFGVVQEGVAWFSDAGDGGPADNDIEALIDLVPGDATGSGSGSGNDEGSGSDDSGDGSNGETQGSGDDPSQPGGQSAGCNASGNASAWLVLAFAGLVRRRQTRSK
jgi:uncharacterized protein (TIGR03382 family)